VDKSSLQTRLVSIDYLRGLASLAVAWFHLTNQYSEDSPVRASGAMGWLGVEVFFVISGFVIPWAVRGDALSRLVNRVAFIWRRAIRVELPYLVSIGLVLALWHASSLHSDFGGVEPSWSLIQLGLHVFYLIPFSDFEWLQPVYWTLAYEFAFYLFVAAAYQWTLGARIGGIGWRALVAGVIVLSAVGLAPIYVCLFLMGASVFRAAMQLITRPECILTIILAGFAMMLGGGSIEAVVGGLSAFSILILRQLRFRGLIDYGFRWLGSISYSLYLIHVPIGGRLVNYGSRFIESNPLSELVLSTIALAASILAGWIFFLIIERPSHALARRIRYYGVR